MRIQFLPYALEVLDQKYGYRKFIDSQGLHLGAFRCEGGYDILTLEKNRRFDGWDNDIVQLALKEGRLAGARRLIPPWAMPDGGAHITIFGKRVLHFHYDKGESVTQVRIGIDDRIPDAEILRYFSNSGWYAGKKMAVYIRDNVPPEQPASLKNQMTENWYDFPLELSADVSARLEAILDSRIGWLDIPAELNPAENPVLLL